MYVGTQGTLSSVLRMSHPCTSPPVPVLVCDDARLPITAAACCARWTLDLRVAPGVGSVPINISAATTVGELRRYGYGCG
jgi:hypothetical protein